MSQEQFVDELFQFVMEWAQAQDENGDFNIESLITAAEAKYPGKPEVGPIIGQILQQFLGGGEEGEFDDFGFPWGEGEEGFPFGFDGEGEDAFNFGF